jgi:uncharacterized sporulation protein YeaH/YhbH (DUF444 family)
MILICDCSLSMTVHRRSLALLVAAETVLSLRMFFPVLDITFIAYGQHAMAAEGCELFARQLPGGTKVSHAYHLCREVIDSHYNHAAGPLYLQHFSDGDNWSRLDNERSVRAAIDILPHTRAFEYVEVGDGVACTTLMASLGRLTHPDFRAIRVTTAEEAALTGWTARAY